MVMPTQSGVWKVPCRSEPYNFGDFQLRFMVLVRKPLHERLPLRSHWLGQWHTGQAIGGRLEHQSLSRRVLWIVAFGNESFVESRPNPSSIAVVAIDRFARTVCHWPSQCDRSGRYLQTNVQLMLVVFAAELAEV